MRYQSRKYYFLSILAHVLLVSFIILSFKESVISQNIGEQQVNEVSSYLYKGQVTPYVGAEQKQQQVMTIKSEKTPVQAEGLRKRMISTLKPDFAKKPDDQELFPSSSASSSHGEDTESLLALLHTAIQSKQHYPLSAMQAENEGRVKVKFTLLTDGNVKYVNLVKSSGTPSLDEAALKAVRDASPFAKIEKYVKMPQEFTIDVVFELS